jgi:GcrA cell cycle regulator
MSWTNERIELLQKLWLEGWSASRIAGELAHGITRNAVIGKVYRLGLSGRAKALPGNVPASPPHHKAPRRPAHRHANSPQDPPGRQEGGRIPVRRPTRPG